MGICQARALSVLVPSFLEIWNKHLNIEDKEQNAYWAAIRTVFLADILGVKVAPMVIISFLRYSLVSPVKFVMVISYK